MKVCDVSNASPAGRGSKASSAVVQTRGRFPKRIVFLDRAISSLKMVGFF